MVLAYIVLSTSARLATISFTSRAAPLSRLVQDLGKATGLKLAVSKECANDVMVISAQSVTVDTLLQKIAKTDAGTWQPEKSLLRFVADQSTRRKEEREEKAASVRQIKAGIKVLVAQTEKEQKEGLSPADSPERQAFVQFTSGLAARKAILGLLSGMDPELLVLHPEQRTVFSSSPTAMQQSLGEDASGCIQQLFETQNLASKASGSDAEIDAPTSGNEGASETVTSQPLKPVTSYSKVDLAISSTGSRDEFVAELSIFDSHGALIAQFPQTLVVETSPPESDSSTEVVQGVEKHIAICEAAQAFRTVYKSQRTGNSSTVTIPAAMLPYLLDIEHHDPLGLTPSDEILALAQSSKKPVVAVVPDSAFADDTFPSPSGDSGRDLTSFVASLKGDGEMVMADKGGWIQIKPSKPSTAREFRCDRRVLAPFLRSCLKESIPTLEEFATFTTEVPNPNRNAVVGGLLTTFVSGFGNANLGTLRNWNLYKIFGWLSADERSVLESGGRLPLTALSTDQQNALFEMVFFQTVVNRGAGPAPLRKAFPSAYPQVTPSDHEADYENEPTELLPNGIEASGYVELASAEEPFVSPVGAEATSPNLPRVLGVAQLARKQVVLSMPRTEANRDAVMYDRFRLGTRTLRSLTLHVSQKAFVTGRLYDFHLDKNSSVVTLDGLPEDWRSEMARRAKNIRASLSQQSDERVQTTGP